MIPKEIREKAEMILKFGDEIMEYLKKEYNFNAYIGDLDIVDEPFGKKLQDGSYEGWLSDCDDTTTYYKFYPMDDGKYLEISYLD